MSDDTETRPHFLHQACEMLGDIADMSELTTTELAALVALLIPVHSRVLLKRVAPSVEAEGNRMLQMVGSGVRRAVRP